MSGRSTHHRGSGLGIDGAEHLRCDVTRPADKIAKAVAANGGAGRLQATG